MYQNKLYNENIVVEPWIHLVVLKPKHITGHIIWTDEYFDQKTSHGTYLHFVI